MLQERLAWILCFSALIGCQQEQPKDEVRRIESIKVSGTCYEDHVGQAAKYEGEFEHWLNVTKNTHEFYGSVYDSDWLHPEKRTERSKNPHKYFPPFIVEFVQIDPAFLEQKNFTLHGISKHATGDRKFQGARYESTCQLVIVDRNRD
jgi:hypothetical protein